VKVVTNEPVIRTQNTGAFSNLNRATHHTLWWPLRLMVQRREIILDTSVTLLENNPPYAVLMEDKIFLYQT